MRMALRICLRNHSDCCHMSVVIDPGEVNCFCGRVMNFVMFLVYFPDNNQDIITGVAYMRSPNASLMSFDIGIGVVTSL